MTTAPTVAFFTRLLDEGDAGERYRLAAEQIAHAEALGYDRRAFKSTPQTQPLD